MSSPSARRSNRSSRNGTPKRASQNLQDTSPAPAVGSQNGNTPHQNRPSQLASSPMFFRSSSVNGNDAPSSPLRQSTQSTSAAAVGPPPSSPLRQQTDTQSVLEDGETTPRARRVMIGESSPLRYPSSSSPARNRSTALHSDIRSESSGLFLGSSNGASRSIRGDIHSERLNGANRPPRRVILGADGQVIQDGSMPPSDAATFSNHQPGTSDADALGGDSQAIIWGTTVSIDDTLTCFKEFLRNFTKKYRLWADGMTQEQTEDIPDADSRPYLEAMELMLALGTNKLFLDIRDLKAYPRTVKIWYQVQAYPQEVIPVMDQAIHDVMLGLASDEMVRQRTGDSAVSGTNGTSRHSTAQAFPSSELGESVAGSQSQTPAADQAPAKRSGELTIEEQVADTIYVVRPFGLDQTINLRDLNPSDMDKMISIKGFVIRATPVIPDMKDALFKCSVCQHSVVVGLDRGKIREPTVCPRKRCESKNSMQIIHNRCTFADKQVIKLQETPDAVPAGQTPHSVSVCVYDDLVDFCKAGDRVEMTGIFCVSPMRVNPRQRAVKSVFKTYVDVLHVQKTDGKRMGVDASTLEDDEDGPDARNRGGLEETRRITPEEVEKIRETSLRPDIYDLLARSLAPSVYEMEDVKRGILLQLFGGTNKSFEKGGSPKYRGDINILLCGDPSTSKSQILSYVHRIAPRGVYTSGKGSSAVGLTAYVTRDPETRQLVLESGALVLSDGGVCCIDEFDKMSEATRSVLHEVMEQQTVSVAKAGIITTLNARTSILASANPIGSRYNPDLPVPQNIDLPPTLLSRFDLVYLIIDRVDEKTDRRLAKHLLSMYLEDTPQSAQSKDDVVPVEFLTSYISYARANIHPTISQPAAQELVNAYVEMRKLGQDVRTADKRITATTRQLESMIRLSEAHAKMRLAPEVTRDDVREAVRLIQSALKTAATDSQGRIDMSLLTEGTSSADRKRKEDFRAAVLALLDEMTAGGGSVRYAEVSRRLGENSGVPVEAAEFGECVRGLEMDGSITVTGEGARRAIRRVTAVV